jgi:hypothetical protein
MYYLTQIDNGIVSIIFSHPRFDIVENKMNAECPTDVKVKDGKNVMNVYKEYIDSGWLYNEIRLHHIKTYQIVEYKNTTPIVLEPVKLKSVSHLPKMRRNPSNFGGFSIPSITEELKLNPLFMNLRKSIVGDD